MKETAVRKVAKRGRAGLWRSNPELKDVPGRKTGVGDAQWLATRARAGLLRASFVPPSRLRELRLVARQRQKLVGQLASEKNRLHKVLAEGGLRLGLVVSDLHGQSARAMVKAIVAGRPTHEVLDLTSRRLRAGRAEPCDALQGELTSSQRFVLDQLMRHTEESEARIARFDARLLDRLLDRLADERRALALLQTLPGVDLIGAAMLPVEIGSHMAAFGGPDRPASWAGVCPGNNESAGTGPRAQGQLLRAPSGVCRLVCEFAHAASRAASVFKS